MKTHNPGGSAFVIRPTVTVAMIYFGMLAVWWLWIFATVKFQTTGSEEAFRLVSLPQFSSLTLLNIVLLVALLVDGSRVREEPPALRRAQFAGIAIGLITLAVAQLGLTYGYQGLAH